MHSWVEAEHSEGSPLHRGRASRGLALGLKASVARLRLARSAAGVRPKAACASLSVLKAGVMYVTAFHICNTTQPISYSEYRAFYDERPLRPSPLAMSLASVNGTSSVVTNMSGCLSYIVIAGSSHGPCSLVVSCIEYWLSCSCVRILYVPLSN